MLIRLYIICGYFQSTTAELGSCRDLMAGKARNIYPLILYTKCWPIPVLGNKGLIPKLLHSPSLSCK